MQLPAAHLDKGREERIEVGLATRLRIRLVGSRRKLPDAVDNHAAGRHPIDDRLEAVSELDG
ncbi:MAG TPA: hypothetical protein VJ454_16895, partial [Steroidobacteraceae bacterium]|nr:hypothetical protein [Steroidobacteraceae bacterium]